MKAETLVNALKKELGGRVSNISVSETVHGKNNARAVRVWAAVKPSDFKKTVKFLSKLEGHAHYCVSSGFDDEKEIEIINHFALNCAEPKKLILFSLRTRVPKRKPEMDSITDLIPGAWVSEKEKQEFLGVKIRGIEPGRLFLDDSLPKGVFPWRKDSKGPGRHAINLHSGERVD